MYRTENRLSHWPLFAVSRAGLLSLLILIFASPFAAAQKQDVVIHESEGLWVLRQPWPESEAWCRNGGGSPTNRVYDVYTYYDAPHERRMERLGSSYEAFVREKVVKGIKQLCGSDTDIPRVIVGMYKKRDDTAPSGLVEDLSNSKTQPWDFMSFKVDGATVTLVSHEAKDAAYHLTPDELRALDPRSDKMLQQARAASQISDYLLYEGDGFTITSLFDRPGKAWCEHVYVLALVIYDGSDDALDGLFKPDYESFLQTEIVPKIQGVCPNFPNEAEYFRQTIRLEFKRAGETRTASSMGFTVAPDGTVAWREGRKTQRQVAKDERQAEEAKRQAEEERREAAQAAARRKEKARQASASKTTSDFLEVECSKTITGYMHVDTTVPYVKMVSTLNTEESKKMGNAMADCFDSLTTVLQLSNPYANSVRFDVIDNAGKSFVKSEVQLTPTSVFKGMHQPEKLRLFSGLWKTTLYEMEVSWDWKKSEFTGVVSNVTPDGALLGFKLGDEILTARIFPGVIANEEGIAMSATLKFVPSTPPIVAEGGLSIVSVQGDFMLFIEGEADDDSLVKKFRRLESR